MQREFICLNGEFFDRNVPVIMHTNRAFLYGDALFETIRCYGTEPVMFDTHWERCTKGMKILGMIAEGTLTRDAIVKFIGKLLNKNRFFKGARVRLTLYRDQGGKYTPDKNSVSWLLESTVLSSEKYALNEKGFNVDIFDGIHKNIDTVSNIKTTNCLLFVLAGNYARNTGYDECFILNRYGHIAESISSNVFISSGNKIATPPLSEGCIAGTMRIHVIQLAAEIGFAVEERPINENQILEAEEIFLTNAILGIAWVGAYKDRRYYNFTAKKLLAALNKKVFN